jgi:CMP-2-keto-3-deoxyoctulosonic acid synthetase
MILGDEPLIFKVVLSQLASILKIFTHFFISLVKKKKKREKKGRSDGRKRLDSESCQKIMFHSSEYSIFTKQKVNKADYPYYSPTSLGESWANEEVRSDASESEAVLTRGQRASA